MRWPLLAIVIFLGLPVSAAEPVKLPITRDTWLSNVGDESRGSNGGATRLKAKSIQELILLDFDPAPLKGRTVTRAFLHMKSASPPDVLKRVTVSSFAADWVEGKSTGYKPEAGSSSFDHRQEPDVPWGSPGDAITDVSLGRGGTIWRMADASPPDRDGWQVVPVDPRVVMARAVGLSTGLLVFDDTGSEWTRNGEAFTYNRFPNRFVYSREQSNSAPYLTVDLGEADTAPPRAPTAVERTSAARVPFGDSLNISWTTPSDAGSSVVGFRVTLNGQPIPRHLIPAPGGTVTMRLRPGDIPATPGFLGFSIRAVDGAGNESPPLEMNRSFNGWSKPFTWTTEVPKPPPAAPGPAPQLGSAAVSVIDPLDKVNPTTGEMIPQQPKEYLQSNHLWSNGTIHLAAARNEFVGFQLVFSRAVEFMSIHFETTSPNITSSKFRYARIPSDKGPLPDPLVTLDDPFSVPLEDEAAAVQKHGSVLVEIHATHDATPGLHKGTLKLWTKSHKLDIPVELTVHSFALPDRLSFIPEMNCYGLPEDELAYYRLAHRNRTVLNRVPYSQRGEPAPGCAPRGAAPAFDCGAWDARFGPLLDGRAFADLPRKGVPLELFYLPLNENWPVPMKGNYNETYWADTAFSASYRRAFSASAQAFASHFAAKGWNDTHFHFFLNNKVDFKQNGWSRASSPWLLDEPANWQDYWALKWFGEAFHEGVRAAGPIKPKMLYRADISRPEWQRDALDAVLDDNVVAGNAFARYHRTVIDRRDRLGQVLVVYGGSNSLETSNVQPAGWCLDAWTMGADGVLPWQTVGTADSWNKADDLAIFYPGKPGIAGPVPSIRLKSYLRGQQDVEYLALLEASTGQSRSAIGEAVRGALKLKAAWSGTGRGGEDAGVIQYGDLKPADLWAVRTRVAAELNKLRVKPATPVTAFRPPQRDFTLASPGK